MTRRVNVAVWLDKYSRWQIKVQKDNIRKTFTSSKPGRTGQRECHKKADMWLDDGIEQGRQTVHKLSLLYMEALKVTTSKTHWTQYQGYFDNWINPKIGKFKIDKISEQHFQAIINDAYSAGLSKKTLSNLKACMLAFLKYCRASKTTTLFFEGLFVPRGAKSKPKPILTPDDIQILFAEDKALSGATEIYINAYRLQLLLGLRPGEVIGLQWRDVRGDTIYIERSINARHEMTEGKNLSAKRSIYLTPLAQKVLQDQKRLRLKNAEGFIFTDKYSERIKQINYSKHWAAYSKLHGLTKTSPYCLRHTFVSAVKTLPEGYLKQTVGHSKSMDTYGVYSHEMQDDKKITADLIQKIFDDILDKD